MKMVGRLGKRLWWGAVLMASGLSVACTSGSTPPEWRRDQELLIAAAVLLDVAQGTEVLRGDSATDMCLSVGEAFHAPRQEPDSRLVAMVNEKMARVYPLSQCEVTAEGVTRVLTGSKAVLLGVAPPVWR